MISKAYELQVNNIEKFKQRLDEFWQSNNALFD